MQYKVRNGYVFRNPARQDDPSLAGTIIDSKQVNIKGQEYKLEAVIEKTGEAKNESAVTTRPAFGAKSNDIGRHEAQKTGAR